jgi:U4/U6.U5 tri-snRNP-associated protein 1
VEGGSIVLNATAEFCRTLGDIPTYGLAGNRDEDAQELLVRVTYVHMTTLIINK